MLLAVNKCAFLLATLLLHVIKGASLFYISVV